MNTLLRSIAVILLLSILAPAQDVFSQTNADLTLFLFRHAEKVDDSKNPHLSDQGRERAEKLFNMLSNEPVTAIYSTPYHRTEETVKHFVDTFNLPVMHYNHRELANFAEELKNKTGRIIVSGHSNTTPQLASQIVDIDVNEIDETVYDNLYIITISNGVATLTVINY